jgi:PAS domain S-box-containing protein
LTLCRDITERKRTEQALRASKEKLDSIFRAAPIGIGVVSNRVLKEVNERVCEMAGYSRAELLEKSSRILYPTDEEFAWVGREKYAQLRERGTGTVETRWRRKDGTVIDVLLSSTPIEPNDWSLGVTFSALDITARKQAETALRASLAEKVALLKEVHHRVKNNLQIVSSLLSLQASQVQEPRALAVLRDTRNRVRSMALIHETLYRSENLARVNFTNYVNNLCTHLMSAYGAEAARLQLAQRVAPVALTLDQAVPCGLIINELISNALKHAFPAGRAGQITVELRDEPNDHTLLCVADNGVGLPDGLEIRQLETMGLQLVFKLVEQLDGALEVDRTGGTAFRIIFPKPLLQERLPH